jgi:LPXTG-site transpeptidase (sortase) family protein
MDLNNIFKNLEINLKEKTIARDETLGLSLYERITTNNFQKTWYSLTRFKITMGVVSFILLSFISFFTYQQIFSRQRAKDNKISTRVLGISDKNTYPKFPVRLLIPSINVDAQIEQVGITGNDEMEVPGDPSNVGWYYLGSRPGENGSAVIDGHLNRTDGRKGVFTDLEKLKLGDEVYVEDNHGDTFTYIVRKSRSYNPGVVEEVFVVNDSPHLNLITCEGKWDKDKNSYTKRLVVFADIKK